MLDTSILRAVTQVVVPLEKKLAALQAQCQQPLKAREDSNGPLAPLPPGQAANPPSVPPQSVEKRKRTDDPGIDLDAFMRLKKAFLDAQPILDAQTPGPSGVVPLSPPQADLGEGDDCPNTSDGDGSRPWRPTASSLGRSDLPADTSLTSHGDSLNPDDLLHPRSTEWCPARKVAAYMASRLRKHLDKEVR